MPRSSASARPAKPEAAQHPATPPTPAPYLSITLNEQALADLAHRSPNIEHLRIGLRLTAPSYDTDKAPSALTLRYQRA
jgi:hypothetical protein